MNEMVSGIYKITNIQNGKCYVGSASNLKTRQNYHYSYLRRNKHFNPHLQNAWNKYGENSFVFEPVEKCPKARLIEREQFWLDKIQCYNRKIGYNIAIKANRTEMSDEHRMRLSVAHKGKVLAKEHVEAIQKSRKGYRHSEETIEKIRKSNQGKKVSLETKRKMSKAKSGSKNPWHGTKGPMGGKKVSIETKIKKSKLSEKQVLEILTLKKEQNISNIKISKLFGVSRGVIDNIVNGKTWSHLKLTGRK